MKKASSARLLTLFLVLTILTNPLIQILRVPEASSESQAADAMWVEPNILLTFDNATVGSRFDITIWLNVTENVIAYQIGLFYNRTQLTCTQAGFTDDFMGSPPHGLSKSGPVIDGGLMGSGSLLICEECNGGDYVQGPHSGSLIWAEFQVLTEPESHANLTSKFDFSARYTWVWDPDLNIIPFALYSGSYTFIAERTPPPPKPPEPPELPAPEGAVIINESQTWHGDFTINESETVII